MRGVGVEHNREEVTSFSVVGRPNQLPGKYAVASACCPSRPTEVWVMCSPTACASPNGHPSPALTLGSGCEKHSDVQSRGAALIHGTAYEVTMVSVGEYDDNTNCEAGRGVILSPLLPPPKVVRPASMGTPMGMFVLSSSEDDSSESLLPFFFPLAAPAPWRRGGGRGGC